MTTVSIRVSDDLLKEADERARLMHIPRAEYVRRAIEEMNRKVLLDLRRERLMAASRRVAAENLAVNAEFAAVEHDIED
jgi:predicted transcriptional regulator